MATILGESPLLTAYPPNLDLALGGLSSTKINIRAFEVRVDEGSEEDGTGEEGLRKPQLKKLEEARGPTPT